MQRNPLDIRSVASCKLCINLGENHVPSWGNPSADLMIIGQSPGRQEVEQLKPFVGPSGEIVDYILDEAEIDRSDCYIANTLKCRPPGNRKGEAAEIANCWSEWLHDEIKFVDPRIVMLLGKDAHSAVLGSRTAFGPLEITKSKKRTYLTTYHPSYHLRRGSLQDYIVDVGAKLKELLG